MPLQSKKINSSSSLLIPGIFLLSLIYWLYLSLTTRMDIVFDSIGYESLGRMIYTHGWIDYFKTGPNREPLYPLLISVSMSIEHLTGLAYVRIMAIFGVIILFLTQVLTYKILRLLNIRQGICALVLVYLAISPSLNNSAFSLYSEITTYPFILGILLASFYVWESINHAQKYRALFYSALLGTLFALTALVKGVFECIAPIYLLILFSTIFLMDKKAVAKRISLFTACAIAAVILFYAPITGFKWLNQHYNGNFVLTNRGSWLIYGNTARRTETLTLRELGADLAYTPGAGVCDHFFSQQECDFWSFQTTDRLGLAEQEELNRQHQHLSLKEMNAAMLHLSIQKVIHDPFQYFLLSTVEGLRMFFWESTQIGFVSYPHWLQKIYDIKILNNVLRLALSLLTCIAVIHLWVTAMIPRKSPLVFLIGVLIFIYIFLFSFVCTLTRYALPIAPLYLITIGIWINNLTLKKIN